MQEMYLIDAICFAMLCNVLGEIKKSGGYDKF